MSINNKLKAFFSGFLLTGVIAFALLGWFFQSYQKQVSIIFYPRNQVNFQNFDIILEDAQIIGESLKMYDQVFATDSNVSLGAFQENQEKWKETISLERIGKSSILKINLQEKDQTELKTISNKFIKYFMPELAKYFSIKEVGFSVLEESAIFKSASLNFQTNFWLSFLLAIVGGLVSAKLVSKIKRNFDQRSYLAQQFQEEENKKEADPESSKINFSKKPTDKEAADLPEAKEIKQKSLQQKPVVEKTNAAPSNLPLAGDEIERMFGATKNGSGYKATQKSEGTSPKKEMLENIDENKYIKEATPEEVKERLNKLLGSI